MDRGAKLCCNSVAGPMAVPYVLSHKKCFILSIELQTALLAADRSNQQLCKSGYLFLLSGVGIISIINYTVIS